MGQKALYVVSVDVAVHQSIAYQPVAIRRCRVNRQQEGQAALIHFVDTQNAGELPHYPRLIVGGEVKRLTIDPTPATNRAFTGLHPEVTGQTGSDTAHSHTVFVDRSHRFLHHPVGVDRSPLQKGRLGA